MNNWASGELMVTQQMCQCWLVSTAPTNRVSIEAQCFFSMGLQGETELSALKGRGGKDMDQA